MILLGIHSRKILTKKIIRRPQKTPKDGAVKIVKTLKSSRQVAWYIIIYLIVIVNLLNSSILNL